MPFPAFSSSEESENYFRIQDPFCLRRSIVPLFIINRETNLITGQGTAFRVDPFGMYLTAHHVLECRETGQFFNSQQLGTVFGMMSPGLVYGRPPIPKDCFAFIDHVDNYRGEVSDPIAKLRGGEETRNIFDCVKFRFDPANQRARDHKDFLHINVSGSWPKIGDRVMAIGYPNVMDVRTDTAEKVTVFTQKMRGAVGEITNLFPNGRGSLRPWPTFEVSCNWPGGMSGGPVFNEEGHVIGLVSSSIEPQAEHDGVGYAFWFQPYRWFERWLPSVDPYNPGWTRGWAVLRRDPWDLQGLYEERWQAEEALKDTKAGYQIIYGSNHYGSNDFYWT